MATHPPEPDPVEPEPEQGAPNTTHLPVEPEFGQMQPAEPEDPGAKAPKP